MRVAERPTARLVLGRSGHLAVNRQKAQEARDLRRAHFHRVTLAVEQDVTPAPGDVRFCGPPAVMAAAQGSAYTGEQAWFRRLAGLVSWTASLERRRPSEGRAYGEAECLSTSIMSWETGLEGSLIEQLWLYNVAVWRHGARVRGRQHGARSPHPGVRCAFEG